jgi:hypothetical protein
MQLRDCSQGVGSPELGGAKGEEGGCPGNKAFPAGWLLAPQTACQHELNKMLSRVLACCVCVWGGVIGNAGDRLGDLAAASG